MKLVFLGSLFSIVWYIRSHKIVRRTYDKEHDTFCHLFLILPCLFLGLFVHEKFTFKEVMCTFSLFLEAAAILPQLVLLQRTKNIDSLTRQYTFVLGYITIPDSLYIVNWVYHYFTEPHYVHWIREISLSLSLYTHVIISIYKCIFYFHYLEFHEILAESTNFKSKMPNSKLR
ncbi:hypothetical protein UlMin_015555 [Ulmus minor]